MLTRAVNFPIKSGELYDQHNLMNCSREIGLNPSIIFQRRYV